MKQQLVGIDSEIQGMRLAAGHANIVKLVEVYEDVFSHHFIVELCQGGDLFQFISHRGTLQEQEAVQVIK